MCRKHFKYVWRRFVWIFGIFTITLTYIVLPLIRFSIIYLIWLCIYISI
nr:MAG TPA: SCIMP protein [Caudoviricetes sp.]